MALRTPIKESCKDARTYIEESLDPSIQDSLTATIEGS